MKAHHVARRVSRLAIRAILVLWLGSGLARSAAAAGGDDPSFLRVRSTDPSLAVLIERAAVKSITFQRLLETIRRSNGIVHVEPGVCGHGVHACLRMWMQTAGSTRFLRVVIDRRRSDSDRDVMGTTGHELQHVVEALSESGTTDSLRLYNFFGRFAPTDKNRFETTAAIQAGDDVRDELRTF